MREMSKEEVIDALWNMIQYGDPWEINKDACREAIRYLRESDSFDYNGDKMV